ncbi:MAG: phosphatase PAP2 family protein [Actinomycetota bacterium]
MDAAASEPDEARATVPGAGTLGPVVEAFDRRIDAALDRLRGNEVLDQLFRTASTAGDFSLVWHALGGVRGVATRRIDQLVVLAVGLGLESLIVNQGIKRLFRRERPTEQGETGLEVRQPSTSSFPSGHASAATFAVVLLSTWERPPRVAGWAAVGFLVATSRVYVRIHHASDVVGGMLIGAGLGLLARPVARRVAPR